MATATSLAHATESPRVSLRYSAPEVCPDDTALVRAVEGFLGQPLAETRQQRLSVSINVQGGVDSFAAKLSFSGAQGTEQRFLEHPDCYKLTEAAALLVALAIDADRVKNRQAADSSAPPPVAADVVVGATPAPSPPVTTAPPSPPPVVNRPAPASPAPPALRATMGFAGVVGVGPLPALSTGIGGELGARSRLVRAAAIARYWAPADADVDGFAGSTVRLSLATIGLRACGTPKWSSWLMLACVGGDVGNLSGTGQGVRNARTRSEVFATAVAAASLAYTRSELSPLIGLELSTALTRPRFGVLDGNEERVAFQPSQWGLLASLGVALGL